MNKSEEVAFLVREFGLLATRAAELVAEAEDEALALAAAEMSRQQQQSLYGEAPVPASSETDPEPNNGGLQKPVIGTGRVGDQPTGERHHDQEYATQAT